MSPPKPAQPNSRGVPRGKVVRMATADSATASPESAKADAETGGQTPRRRVAIYSRVSSNTQATKGTIDSQIEALRSHVAGLGAEVVATYIDDGYSGARLDRPGLDELRDAAEAGVFDEVWCLSPDRLARSFPYQVLIIDELARLSVAVRFTDTPPIDDDPQARLLVQVQGLFAEYEKAKIAERARRGKLYRVREGEAVFGMVPYGYRRIPRGSQGPAHLVIYEPEAAVVRRVFDEYVAGSSLRQIAMRLYDDDIPTATGKATWSPTTISALLTNPTYMGKAAWYRTIQVTPPGGGRTQRRPRPKEDWVEVNVPAIVNEVTFSAAQAARANHSAFSARRATPGQWLLRRLVVCGACGGHAGAKQMTTSASQKVNRYYSCDNRDPLRAGGPDRVCKQQRIRADQLDAFVWDKIQGVLLRPDVLLAGETAVISRQAPNDELLDTQRERLARQLEQADTERRRLADLYQAGLIDLAELNRRGAEITARRASLEAEHEELTKRHQELAAGNRLRRRLADFAARVANGLDSLDFEGRQRLLRLVIEEVRVTGWQVEIRLRIPLSDNPGDGDESNPPTPNSPSPKPTSVRRKPARRPVSTELRLSQGDPRASGRLLQRTHGNERMTSLFSARFNWTGH